MSTYLDFSIKTKEEFKDWIARMLGEPLITVELDDDQYEICINNAIEEFSKYFSAEDYYYALNISTYPTSGFTLPENTLAVTTFYDDLISTAGNANQLFSIPNAMWNAGVLPNFSTGQGWLNYELAMESLKFTKYMTGKGFQFDYNVRTKVLTLTPDPSLFDYPDGWIVLGLKTMRPENQQYGESWVKKYALAEAKILLGTIRSKFVGVQLLGGGTIDTSIKNEGIQERDKLLEQLKKQESGAWGFFVG